MAVRHSEPEGGASTLSNAAHEPFFPAISTPHSVALIQQVGPGASVGPTTLASTAAHTDAREPVADAETATSRRLAFSGRAGNLADFEAARLGIERLFQAEAFPTGAANDLGWHRDALGKPFVRWSGSIAAWAETTGRSSRDLHVSNTHDGGSHIVMAAYGEELAGIGIDAVWLPRLRHAGKDAAYLLRFARRFMSLEEWAAFSADSAELACQFEPIPTDTGALPAPSAQLLTQASPRALPPLPSHSLAAGDPDEPLRLRVAAHFSLMEAASKACGTGLKIGVGMGKPTSLPKQSLGALRLTPHVELLFGPEARIRLETLGVTRYEACVCADREFLISAVALYRSTPEKSQTQAGGKQA